MPQLVVEFPDGRRQRFTLGQNEVILGRDQACDICLPDPKISRRHAKIRRQGADWVIEDMGSINGYLVDGTASHGRSKLHPGSRIVLGEFALVIEADGAAAQARADMPAFSLYVTEGPLAGQRLALQNGELSVGRSSEADVALDDPSMSRRHASLRVSADGVEVRDLGSSNGTFVDGEQVRQQRVKTGQIIRFGNVKMRLEGQPAGQNSPQRHEVSVATRDVAHKVRASLPDLKAAEAAGSPHAAASAK